MKNYKKIIGILLAVGLTFGVIGCGNNAEKEEGKTTQTGTETQNNIKELKKVNIANPGVEGVLTEIAGVAQKENFFEEELSKVGYEPDYQGFAQAGPAINEAFASGAIDAAIYGDMPVVTAKSNDVDVKVIASVTSKLEYAIVAANDANISSVQDLKGKKIAVGFGTGPYRYLGNFLSKNDLSINSDVEIINSSTDGPTMLSSGQIDAFVTQLSAGYAYQAANIGKVVFTTRDDETFSDQMVLAVRTEFLENNREAAVALVRALYDAYDFAKTDPEGVYSDLATENFPKEIQEQVYSDQSFEYFDPTIDDLTIEKLKDLIKYEKDNQLISSEVDVDSLIDKSITAEAGK